MTPAERAYRWPAEWEPHVATWISWPHNRETWPGRFERVRPQMAAMVRTVAEHEPVHVLAGGGEVMASAQSWLGTNSQVFLHDIPTNDAWCRDHGPLFLQAPAGEPPALVDWKYNAWGSKYPPFELDDAVPEHVATELGYQRFAPGMVLEGGSIEGNGDGLLLTTESCLLNRNRNPGWSRAAIERHLRDFLGVEKILWLNGGNLAGDDTDGHIDQLARFVTPTTVVAAAEDDPSDANHAPLARNLAALQAMTDRWGRPLEIVRLPLPRAMFGAGQRLPASYCNFYLANGLCLVPQFDDPADEAACRILGSLLPDHRVVGLPAFDLVWGLGAFHCLTQQQPCPTIQPADQGTDHG